MKNLFTIFITTTILLLTACEQNIDLDNNNHFINEETENTYSKIYIDAINNLENDNYDVSLKYNLVYIDDDEIPELVVDLQDYWIQIYTLKDEKAINILNDEYLNYGTNGRVGYEYAPKKSVIKCVSHDNEKYGYTEYYEKDDNEKINLSYTLETVIFSEDENELGNQNEYGKLLYTDLTKCNFELLEGIDTAKEIIAKLEKKI